MPSRVTTALRGSDGQPLRAATPGITRARATTVLSPAFDALAALGIARDRRIASVTRFTVDDVASDVLAARTIARAAAKPVCNRPTRCG